MKNTTAKELQKLSAQILLNLSRNPGRKVFLFASTLSGEGTTTVLSQLARQMGKGTKTRILLVDANLRAPRLHEIWNVPRSPGLTELCATNGDMEAGIRETDGGNLFLLPAGEEVPNPMEILLGEGFKKLVAQCRNRFDFLFFDSPPLALYRDALAFGPFIEGTLMVIRIGFASREEIQHSKDLLDEHGMEVVGGIINRNKRDVPQIVKKLFNLHEGG